MISGVTVAVMDATSIQYWQQNLRQDMTVIDFASHGTKKPMNALVNQSPRPMDH